jgi:hypothetical protein
LFPAADDLGCQSLQDLGIKLVQREQHRVLDRYRQGFRVLHGPQDLRQRPLFGRSVLLTIIELKVLDDDLRPAAFGCQGANAASRLPPVLLTPASFIGRLPLLCAAAIRCHSLVLIPG